jgi:hypothetical protein
VGGLVRAVPAFELAIYSFPSRPVPLLSCILRVQSTAKCTGRHLFLNPSCALDLRGQLIVNRGCTSKDSGVVGMKE